MNAMLLCALISLLTIIFSLILKPALTTVLFTSNKMRRVKIFLLIQKLMEVETRGLSTPVVYCLAPGEFDGIHRRPRLSRQIRHPDTGWTAPGHFWRGLGGSR
jgi:hypothetical protein